MKSIGIVHLVVGPQGAGKTTYARLLAEEENAVRFSIDEWMHRLFAADAPRSASLGWVLARVWRCEDQIWELASQICQSGGSVVLDLGFMKRESRDRFRERAAQIGVDTQLHALDAPYSVRKARVLHRNIEKGNTFSFVVTPMVFDFMDKEFERLSDEELSNALITDHVVMEQESAVA